MAYAANEWLNSDGLLVKFGATEGDQGRAGEYELDGPYHVTELVIQDMTTLTSSAVIQDDNCFIPKGARIDRVSVVSETAATSGGSATLNIGLIKDDRTTNVSDTALISALALSSINANGANNDIYVGSTGAGSSIGTSLASPSLFTAKWGTAVYTAGKAIVRVYWRIPVTV